MDIHVRYGRISRVPNKVRDYKNRDTVHANARSENQFGSLLRSGQHLLCLLIWLAHDNKAEKGSMVMLAINLIGGSTFKIIGLMFCNRWTRSDMCNSDRGAKREHYSMFTITTFPRWREGDFRHATIAEVIGNSDRTITSEKRSTNYNTVPLKVSPSYE